jgi:hypothetical protein
MANEINVMAATGQSLVYDLRDGATAVSLGNALAEVSGTGYYYGSVPGGVGAGLYTVIVRAGSNNLGIGSLRYDGTAEILPASTALATNIQGRLPSALVSGRIDASVGAMAANTVTAAAVAADAVAELGGATPAAVAQAVWDHVQP